MIKIDVQLDEESPDRKGNFAICPVCKQKIMDVEEVCGSSSIRIICRRCRKFMRVRLTKE